MSFPLCGWAPLIFFFRSVYHLNFSNPLQQKYMAYIKQKIP